MMAIGYAGEHLPLLCALALLLVVAMPLSADISRVWAVNDGEKIRRDDLANPNATRNSIWDGEGISLFAARNEIVAFQVVLEAGPEGARRVDVRLERLTADDGVELVAVAERDDPTDTTGGQIEAFVEHYVRIVKPSSPGWFYSEAARPGNMTGWTPDALVPLGVGSDANSRQMDIEPSSNAVVWFDVYVPKQGAQAGIYKGSAVVTEDGEPVADIPVSLRVFDFVLPDETHFPVMVWFEESGVSRRHGVDEPALTAELLNRYHRLAHRHRVEFTKAYPLEASQASLDLISGRAFMPDRGYAGPGEGIGYTIVPPEFYGIGGNEAWMGDEAWETADAYMQWLEGVKPRAITFLYITDEPPPARFPWIASICGKHHDNPGPGGKLPMFVTKGPSDELEGSIDIWCTVANHVDLAEVAEQKQKGRQWWYYNGMRPWSGTQITDTPAVDCRVPAWACFRHDIELWFYWHANHWQHNSQSERGNQDQNVWVDPVTFGGGGGINGDGVLVYAGQDAIFPEEDRGVAGPIASIRLKNIRRGVQDYEYLWLARKHGLDGAVRRAVDACVPRVFSEAHRDQDVSWSISGSDWDEVRLLLAEEIERRGG